MVGTWFMLFLGVRKMTWGELLKIKKDLLEQILKDFEENGVTDAKAKAIIAGRLEGIYNLEGVANDD